jgi:hypothetical protein
MMGNDLEVIIWIAATGSILKKYPCLISPYTSFVVAVMFLISVVFFILPGKFGDCQLFAFCISYAQNSSLISHGLMLLIIFVVI